MLTGNAFGRVCLSVYKLHYWYADLCIFIMYLGQTHQVKIKVTGPRKQVHVPCLQVVCP